MLRDVVFIVLMILLIYLGVCSIFSHPSFVGSVGESLGNGNKALFGYTAYIYPFLLVYVLPKIFKMEYFELRFFEILLSVFLLFIDILIVQAIVISGAMKGFVGLSIVDMMQNFIGTVGVWLFVLMIAALSCTILFDVDIYALYKDIRNNGKIGNFKQYIKGFFKKNEYKIESSYEEPSTLVTSEDIPLQQIVREEIKKELLANQEQLKSEFILEEIQVDEVKSQIKTESVQKQPETIASDDEVVENIVEEPQPQVLNTQSQTIEQKPKSHTTVLSEVEENKKFLESLEQGGVQTPKDFRLPSLNFLTNPKGGGSKVSESEIDQKISDLLEKLRKFKIDGDVVRTYAGPVVTTFEFRPAPHIKVSKILTLQDDLAMALKAQTIRIQAPVPGKDVVGIEIPNRQIDTIYLRSVLDSDIFKKSSSPLTIALGKDIVGNPFVTDLKKLPHLLIAGTTGSGKSVGINAMLLSLLYRNSPETLRLLMIDPKMLEFSMYNDIPHLLTPVITQSKEAVAALANMVSEMERRYQIMSKSKTKNIESYNAKAKKEGWTSMCYIVVIIDELADLMMTSGKDVEVYISRLAQMARAAGIHLLVATQRPSVDVVTGLIKANLPSRISFKVGSKIDSKVILDSYGAESLLGRGDMLFTPPSSPSIIRLHAPFASEEEIENIVEYLKTQGEPMYDKSFLKDPNASELDGDFDSSDIDELYDQAKAIVLEENKTSISYLQRRLSIGYNRAANIVEQLEKMGVLTPPNSKGQREIA